MTESSGFVEQISSEFAVLYSQSKGVWPTAPRDCLVVSFKSILEDGRYCNVTQSIDEHPNYQQRSGSERMIAHLAGLIVGPHSSKNPNLCHCVQIIDGTLLLI